MARLPLRLALSLALPLLLTACSNPPPTPEELPTQPVVQSSASSEVPHPATYQGQIQQAGISIYQEGTHRLVLNDGSFVLLEGDGVNLDTYVGQTVEVRGLERRTVEAGGLIVAVQSVTVLSASSSSGASVDSSQSSSVSSQVHAVVPPPVSSAAPASSAGSSVAINPMVKYKVDATTMTQTYCSSHAGFCMPVHKSGWWKAFGATGKSLWHVEVSSQEITDLGQGPLSVDVISGSLADAGATDGELTTQGNQAVGYRAFGDHKYIMVSAPLEMQQLVSYTTKNISFSASSESSADSAASVTQ